MTAQLRFLFTAQAISVFLASVAPHFSSKALGCRHFFNSLLAALFFRPAARPIYTDSQKRSSAVVRGAVSMR